MSKRKTYINKILCVLLSTMMLFSNISVAFAESMTNDSTSQAEVSASTPSKWMIYIPQAKKCSQDMNRNRFLLRKNNSFLLDKI